MGDFLAPCGLDRRFIEFDAVYFDGFNEVGIVADKTKHAHWKNVAFGENNPAAP